MRELDTLKKKIVEDASAFVIILGAGASMSAGLPSWNGLKEKLCESIEELYEDPAECAEKIESINNQNTLWKSFGKLREYLGQTKYEKEIRQILDPPNLPIPSIYNKLWQLNTSGIIDFNIDRLAINSFSEIEQKAVDYATGAEPHKYKNFLVSGGRFVFFPHGYIIDPNSWVFTEKERRQLYDNSDYINFMCALLNSKNLLIVGFNPTEWSFLELIQNIGIKGKIAGFHNYYLCPDASQDVRRQLEEVGISVINYHPSSANHTELRDLLDTFLSYQSTDEILPSIYSGKQYQESDIPGAQECYKYTLEELRNILNGVIANIIPPDRAPNESQIDKLSDFYNTYVQQLHRAWLVDPRTDDTNDVYGYKVTRFIGNGAFGSVFEAEDNTGQRYALKVLLPEVKDKISFLSCFRRGIRSMKILTEKNIPGMVKIHASYEVPACIVMDFVDGITLREAIDKKYLTQLNIKIRILLKIAKIIHQAHQLEERILHRDLKPENIMLENCYSSIDFDDPTSIPNVKILDFDLSWHRGATEKTVMVGAASQGFMAPEQTDTSIDKSLSRNTAVDVYSLGMLTYYVLTGNNPLPNEPLFEGFRDRTLLSIQKKYRFAWKCLPMYLTETIIKTSSAKQTDRLSLDTLISNLNVAAEMYIHNTIHNTHPLLLLELSRRIDSQGRESISDFGRTITIDYPEISKRIILATASSRKKEVILTVSIERYINNADQRENISKYFKAKCERAVSKVDKKRFKVSHSESSNTNIMIQLESALPTSLSLDDITALANNIFEVRFALDN